MVADSCVSSICVADASTTQSSLKPATNSKMSEHKSSTFAAQASTSHSSILPPNPRNHNPNYTMQGRRNMQRRLRRKASKGPQYVSKRSQSECTVFHSSKPSSERTKAGSMALKHRQNILSRNPIRHCARRLNRKKLKMDAVLLESKLPCSFKGKCIDYDDLRRYCLVFDGGDKDTPPLTPPEGQYRYSKTVPYADLPWKALRIADGDLFISDTKNPCKGLVYNQVCGNPVYIRIPRKASLEITRLGMLEDSSKLCKALHSGFLAQRQTLHRGKSRRIFSDFKYCTLGNQTRRNEPGIRQLTYHSTTMPPEDWDFLLEMMERVETALSSFVPSDCIRAVNEARKLIKFPTMAPSNGCRGHSSKIFGGIAFGANVHLSCHTDSDFTYSVVSAHLYGHQNGLNDCIIAYFCFPRLGIAIPLRSGDLLVFNPSEPHAVSSRCREKDFVYCMSMYLKTAVVGLNDNSQSLTKEQKEVLHS